MLLKQFSIFFIVLMVMLALFLLKKKRTQRHNTTVVPIAVVEVDTFSGGSPQETQLDLAQAYVELQQYEKAKYLLKAVITAGDSQQALEARKIFTQLLKQERKLCSA